MERLDIKKGSRVLCASAKERGYYLENCCDACIKKINPIEARERESMYKKSMGHFFKLFGKD